MSNRPRRKETADNYKGARLMKMPERIRMLAQAEDCFSQIRKILVELENDDCERDRLLAHVRSLARFRAEPMDYDEDNIAIPGFPDEIWVAYAVCHPECGMKEFIVDGSTQECTNCGGSMFRTESAVYNKRG